MGRTISLEERRRQARDALATGPQDQRLFVQCARGHHVADVLQTPAGLVFRAAVGPHVRSEIPHQVAPHDAPQGTEYVDLLEPHPDAGDLLPASCDCGSWALSRTELLTEAAHGRPLLRLG